MSGVDSAPTEELGFVLDAETEKVTAIQTSHQPESNILQTEGHSASVALSSNSRSSFIIAYQGMNFHKHGILYHFSKITQIIGHTENA